MTEEELKTIEDQLKSKADSAGDKNDIRDKTDMVEIIVDAAIRKFEAITADRDKRKLAPQESDAPNVRAKKWKQLIGSLALGDREAYKDAYAYFSKSDPSLATREFSTTDAAGGHSIPPDVKTDIMRQAVESGVVRKYANIFPTTSDAVTLNAILTSVSAAWGTENTAVSGSSGTQTAPTLAVGKIIGMLGPFSSEILADAAPDFYQAWVEQMGSYIGQLEDYTGFLGDGTATYNSVSGAFITTTGGVDRTSAVLATTNVVVDIDLIDTLRDAITSVPSNRRLGAAFFMHRSLEGALYNVKSTTGVPILVPANSTLGGTLMGYPYVLVECLPDISTIGADTAFAGFGNLKNCLHVADRQQIFLKIGTEGTVDSKSMFAADQLAVRITERLGMVVHVPRATKLSASGNVEQKGFTVIKTKA